MHALQFCDNVSARGAVVLAILTLCLACSPKPTLRLEDTEGRVFQATCERRKPCAIASSAKAHPSTPQPQGARPGYELRQASRLYVVCDAWIKGKDAPESVPQDCRPFVCSSDAQCPPATGMKTGACTNRVCIEPTGPIMASDAIALCLAGSGAPAGIPAQVERFALGNNCGNPCRVPAVCRQL